MVNVSLVWDYIISIALASVGGFAALLNKSQKAKLTKRKILYNLIIDGFIGLMVMLFCTSILNLSGNVLAFVCGIAGWIGTPIISSLEKKAKQTIGINDEKEIAKDEK